MSDVPESKELLFHHFRTEITRLELESLEKLRTENLNRWTRVGELREFWTALKSHASVDAEWIAEWEARTMSVLKGEPRD